MTDATVTDITKYDPYRREAEEAAFDEDEKATRRYINAMILHHEAQAEGISTATWPDVKANSLRALECEVWAYNRGIAEGLRMALRAFRQNNEGASLA